MNERSPRMKCRRCLLILHGILFVALLTSCSTVQQSGSSQDAEPDPSLDVIAVNHIGELEEQSIASADTINSKSTDVESNQSDVEADALFDPPFPNRLDPFKQPEFRQLAQSQSKELDETAAIRLKGFLNVDGLRALVSIDGDMSILREGDEKNGIRVIAVAPPQVILQRGRIRWTEALYDAGRVN